MAEVVTSEPQSDANEQHRSSGELAAARDSSGRFGKGNPGRPVGTRVRLAESFLRACMESFEKHGPKTLESLRQTDPGAYCKVIASLVPKEIEMGGADGGPLQIIVRRMNDA